MPRAWPPKLRPPRWRPHLVSEAAGSEPAGKRPARFPFLKRELKRKGRSFLRLLKILEFFSIVFFFNGCRISSAFCSFFLGPCSFSAFGTPKGFSLPRPGTDFIYKFYARNAWDISNQIDDQVPRGTRRVSWVFPLKKKGLSGKGEKASEKMGISDENMFWRFLKYLRFINLQEGWIFVSCSRASPLKTCQKTTTLNAKTAPDLASSFGPTGCKQTAFWERLLHLPFPADYVFPSVGTVWFQMISLLFRL